MFVDDSRWPCNAPCYNVTSTTGCSRSVAGFWPFSPSEAFRVGAFNLEIGADQIGVLTYDVPGAKVNTLGGPVLKELAGVLDDLEKRTELKGLILRSGKPGQFIAGADLNEIAALAYVTPEQALKGLNFGHALFDRMSRLPYPTVALVDGAAMGGGTEIILAMDYRICSTNPKTVIGLPEVKVGVIPGWGGTQRLPRLIGVPNAIEMITSGEPVNAKKAVQLGLVFDAVPVEKLMDEGKRLLAWANETGDWKTSRQKRSQPVGMSETEFAFAFGVAEAAVKEKTKGQYPAPLVALAAVKEGCNLTLEQGLAVEKQKATEVMGSAIAANLIAIFFMTSKLERDPGVADKNVKPKEVKRVGVIGAGLMGAGIAAAHARSGFGTVVNEVDDARLAAGLERMKEVVTSRIKIGRAKPEDLADMLGRVTASTKLEAFADCDVVVEAMTENEELKTATYRKLAGILKPDAILASNTSTISITRMAAAAPAADRFIGMHFFNPVDRMQLVEVIRGKQTSDETTATIVALAKKCKKTPIVVNDCAGFLVNRILFPYMNEAIVLLCEGADMDAIDKAATAFGMPMGPILLHDVVGLDTGWFAGNVIAKAYPDRAVTTPLVGDLVQRGFLGQKSGAGFRLHGKKDAKGTVNPELAGLLEKHRVAGAAPSQDELTDRLFLPMLFEAARTLEDGIAKDAADVDMGLILGLGFPPFRGGILRWCDTEGAANIVRRAERFAKLGKRYETPESIRKMASSGDKFFPRPKDLPSFGG
jgi:3-hydroxyacyl-CoA dehydrogenase/enoyl-CoA hydratase/3-hydroxybutyryl-CoA epimerase/3-hydroxyacyl-CoA dehydrogenase/enoyl-CoA hydratase/3-hydroxybutyryl-CoA epimerase/enoyl-CoA isomerase